LDFSSIKNIIFDLGGVIINIDFQLTFEAFAKLGNTDILTILKKFEQLEIFKRYEKGEFTDNEVRDLFRKEFNSDLSDKQFDDAWNALLQDIPLKRIELIQQLKNKYRLFLLSNTNNIHIKKVNQILYESSKVNMLDDLFEKAYYSYSICMGKPDLEIYQHVLRDKNLKAEETLFIDDNKDNIEGAKAAGLKVIHVQSPETILELLKDA
jgi:glucose-1-phosphatase